MTSTVNNRVWSTDQAGWRMQAACYGLDPEIFFSLYATGGTASSRKLAAKRVCGRCTVAAECLSGAMRHGEGWGIWGGLSEHERRRLRVSWISKVLRQARAPEESV